MTADSTTSRAATATATTRLISLLRLGGLTAWRRYSFILAALLAIVLLVVNLWRTSGFDWTTQLANFAPLALAAMASTPAIISGGGGLDLSISPLMIFCSGLYVMVLVPHGTGGIEAVPILLLVGAGMGLLNGLLIVLLRLPAVVVTLATFFILSGADLRLIPEPTSLASTWLTDLARDVGPIPGPLFLLAPPLILWFALQMIPYGRALYFVGSSDAAAFSSGINVAVVRAVAYMIGGIIAAVGAMSIIAATATASGNLAQTYALGAIAAVALGGTSLWGGRGGLIGSLFGAACIYLLGNLLITFNVSPSWLQVMYGAMLLVAVSATGLSTRISDRSA